LYFAKPTDILGQFITSAEIFAIAVEKKYDLSGFVIGVEVESRDKSRGRGSRRGGRVKQVTGQFRRGVAEVLRGTQSYKLHK
jgi:hypothetical protein